MPGRVPDRDRVLQRKLEQFAVDFLLENGRGPTLVELWLAREALASLELDRDSDGQTISLETLEARRAEK